LERNLQEEKEWLESSLLRFTQNFFSLRTGRKFELSEPAGRESHYITICRALHKVMRGESTRLIINVPPRYGKTELLIHFVAWALAQYPDSNFLYVSYSLGLAKKQTKTIRQIVAMSEFRDIFGVGLSGETSAQGNFETIQGGSVYAAGADGEITGRGAGIKGAARFGGAIIIDDIHKPSEVNSDTIRQSVNDWYFNTLQSRLNEPDKTPIIFIGQRLHEDDLAGNLIQSGDWEKVIIPAMDEAGNALHPAMHSVEKLFKMQETMPYVYSSQYQQDPLPAGGGIFKTEWFYQTEEEPEILATFICADTAETDKSYNDATVFSFFGIYKIKQGDVETDMIGLHWIDCLEIRIEPKDLEPEFLNFYTGCMRYKVKPKLVAIEKKSTGVTLLSILKNIRGLQVLDIERTKSSGNKTTRFLEIQPIIAGKQVSIPKEARHTAKVIDHMRKITANDSHRHDDIADTLYDGVKLGIIDNIILNATPARVQEDERVARTIMGSFTRLLQLRSQR
jgi:predicted phage terminase large subunit-like protein